jgi:hypothetical protein
MPHGVLANSERGLLVADNALVEAEHATWPAAEIAVEAITESQASARRMRAASRGKFREGVQAT